MRMVTLKTAGTVSFVSVILLLVVLSLALVAAQAPPTGTLWVTYVDATPTSTATGDTLTIVFRVVYFVCDPYLGSIAQNATGIKSATFLLSSVATQQSNEHPNTPVYPTGRDGEYRGEITITADDPTGKIWVYVKGMSLSLSVTGGQLLGPPINTASEQTYDTSDLSLIEIGQVSSPSTLDDLLQGNGLWFLLLAALVILLLAVSLLARRRRNPTA